MLNTRLYRCKKCLGERQQPGS